MSPVDDPWIISTSEWRAYVFNLVMSAFGPVDRSSPARCTTR